MDEGYTGNIAELVFYLRTLEERIRQLEAGVKPLEPWEDNWRKQLEDTIKILSDRDRQWYMDVMVVKKQ